MSLNIMSFMSSANGDAPGLGGSIPVSADSDCRMSILPRTLDVLPKDHVHSNSHYYYFTLALPQSRFYNRGYDEEIKRYYVEKFKELSSLISGVQLFYSLEYCSDGVNVHAHGVLTHWTRQSFLKLKQQIRKTFNILPHNRVAIKWYQNNNKNHTGLDKIKYHLMGIDYKGNTKDLVDDHIYKIDTVGQIINTSTVRLL